MEEAVHNQLSSAMRAHPSMPSRWTITVAALMQMIALSSAANCVADWGQCGGSDWRGSTCCREIGSCCVSSDRFWSACQPKDRCPAVAAVAPVATVSPGTTAAARRPEQPLELANCKEDWQQCGGRDYTGPTCCRRSDSCCSRQSDDYFYCRVRWEAEQCTEPGTTVANIRTSTLQLYVATTATTTYTLTTNQTSTAISNTSTTTLPLAVAVLSGEFWSQLAAPNSTPHDFVESTVPTCRIPASYSDCQLRAIIERNCLKVAHAAKDLQSAISAPIPGMDHGPKQTQFWVRKGIKALEACASVLLNDSIGVNWTECSSQRSARMVEAAAKAVNAWGATIMEGQECCVLLSAPYCVGVAWSNSTKAMVAIVFALLAVIMISSMIVARRRAGTTETLRNLESTAGLTPGGQEKPPAEFSRGKGVEIPASRAPKTFSTAVVGASATPLPAPVAKKLTPELEHAWIGLSCLRVLPGAIDFAHSTASLFGALQEAFDFQHDSVRNQHEHLLSMWRSHCAMVVDRAIGNNVSKIDEKGLLAEALGDLHAELLDSFCLWQAGLRQALAEVDPSEKHKANKIAQLGDADWDPIPSTAVLSRLGLPSPEFATELSAQLAEIAVYLLVWGEAANLRFMPEALYLIVELALSAAASGSWSCDDLSPTDESLRPAEEHGDSGGRFLVEVVRPIYNMIFDEWYDSVESRPDGKDTKKLHKGFDAFLPADAANYDDWNEFFCDHKRVTEQLTLADGTLLFDIPKAQRFAALPRVDWVGSLSGHKTKTHREIHSLWGVFAATHRIWLLHVTLFFASVLVLAETPQPWKQRLLWLGFDWGCLAPLGLVVPIHGSLWLVASWQVTGHAFRKNILSRLFSQRGLFNCVFSVMPMVTYAVLRIVAEQHYLSVVITCLLMHYLVCSIGLYIYLVMPSTDELQWTLTQVPLRKRAMRWFFWLLLLCWKFAVGMFSVGAIQNAILQLNMMLPGQESPADVGSIFLSMDTAVNLMLWLLLWFTSFVLYCVDTQLWFVVACSVLGIIISLAQRKFNCMQFCLEDAIAKIPERFSKNVLWYAPSQPDSFAPGFAPIWDRIVEYLRYEDNITDELLGNLSFAAGTECAGVNWESLTRPLEKTSENGEVALCAEAVILCKSGCGYLRQRGLVELGEPFDTCCRGCSLRPGRGEHDESCLRKSSASICSVDSPTSTCLGAARMSPTTPGAWSSEGEITLKQPDIFRRKNACEIFSKHYLGVPDPQWPKTPNVQWRIVALARSLGLPMPRPYRPPYIPGLTVLIPHYGETIILRKKELLRQEREGIVPLIDWVKANWTEEFSSFTSRMQATHRPVDKSDTTKSWRMAGTQWEEYGDAQWDTISSWCSMRMQTLWRTVAGMCLYHPALQCHYEAQGEHNISPLAHPSVWDPSDCFTCLVAMQMYKSFDESQLEDTNRMLQKFPSCLKIAFIDDEEQGSAAGADRFHRNQQRRYFSCLIDRSCENDEGGRKLPKFRIELPGYPILGDGKSDNQNHALPFMRGTLAQCIDANQGAYFEQMLLLPCLLGEFRSHERGDGKSKRIVGMPEHITSDIGSVGDMAASAEMAFGTILQRSYAALGVRMHYGHPDIMSASCMMQQGGVSKATKTLNLSEDIFAGMDFTLRGGEREIHHCEYFHLAKGRDLGFNTVQAFFSKLASGCGEQLLTRQVFRLGQAFPLPQCLSFYYAHVGYYLNQFFISWSSPLLVCCWLLVLLSDCEGKFDAFQHCTRGFASGLGAAEVMAGTLSTWFSWLLLLFFIATSAPFVIETWMERSLKIAVGRLLRQILTLSPLLFIFQTKVIGFYVVSELQNGGATYVSTGRGLPTERRPFLGEAEASGFRLRKVGGLYLDYATIAYYDGALLLVACVLVTMAGGAGGFGSDLSWTWICLGLVITSWLYAPFLFNPYQFVWQHFKDDLRCWVAFFSEGGSKHWVEWYSKKQLKAQESRGFAPTISVFLTAFFLLTWCSTVSLKMNSLGALYSQPVTMLFGSVERLVALAPPIATSAAYALLISALRFCCRCLRRLRRVDEELPLCGPSSASRLCSKGGFPLTLSAFFMLAIDFIEAYYALREFYFVGWKKAMIAGFVLKFALLATCVHVGEICLYSKHAVRAGCIRQPLKFWVQAHRMGRDIVTSSLILCGLFPLVLLNALNNSLCQGCNVHQLLIYRNTGLRARDNVKLRRDGEHRSAPDRTPGSTSRSRGSQTPAGSRSARSGSTRSQSDVNLGRSFRSGSTRSQSDVNLGDIFDNKSGRKVVRKVEFAPNESGMKSEPKLVSIVSQSVKECEAAYLDSFPDV